MVADYLYRHSGIFQVDNIHIFIVIINLRKCNRYKILI